MRNILLIKEKYWKEIEEVKNELLELETNQHPKFYRNEVKGRKRMASLLLKLNILEEKE